MRSGLEEQIEETRARPANHCCCFCFSLVNLDLPALSDWLTSSAAFVRCKDKLLTYERSTETSTADYKDLDIKSCVQP